MPRTSPAARAAMTSRFSKQIDRDVGGQQLIDEVDDVVDRPARPSSQHILGAVESEPFGVPAYER